MKTKKSSSDLKEATTTKNRVVIEHQQSSKNKIIVCIDL